jgi:6-phosphogluconolactonase
MLRGSREGRRISMKLTKIGQGLLAVAGCLGLGLGISSCSPSDTIDYLFVTSNSTAGGCSGNGEIDSYHVDSQSGAISVVAGSPVCSQGANPVAEVASPNGQYLYVANHGSNNIAEFAIGTDGQLVFAKAYTTPGSGPVSLAINNAGTLLFVLDYYQAGFSDTTPGPGALVVYPVNSDGSLGSPVASGGLSYTALQCFPGGVAVSPNGSYAFVSNTNSVVVTTSPPTTATPPATPAGCPAQGTISGFLVSSSGVLTSIPGSPFAAGTTPTGIAIDQTSRFLYTTDSVQNQLIVYQIEGGGTLLPNINGPFATGTFPVNLVVDPRDQYLYVSNYNSSTVSEFTISQINGAPSALASSSFSTGDPGPTCILVDPALGRYVYASLSQFNAVAAAQLNPNTGVLTGVQNAPYSVTGTATCVAAVPHGNHASQTVTSTSGQ